MSLVFGATRPRDASQPTRIEVDPRAIGLVWFRAAASVWSTGSCAVRSRGTATQRRVVSYCLTLLELDKPLLIEASAFVRRSRVLNCPGSTCRWYERIVRGAHRRLRM